MLMKKITLFLIAVAALAFAAHAGQLSASPGTTTSVEPAIANSLSDLSQPVDETEQTWAPTFYGYSEDGVQGFGVRIIETEPSTIYYRIMYPFPDGEWTDWMEYTDMLMFNDPGRYRVEAYAVADGKTPSQTIAFEFMVMEITEAPVINCYTVDGRQGTHVDIVESEPGCTIWYYVRYPSGECTDLMQFSETMLFTEPGIYHIEAYAVVDGKIQSGYVYLDFEVQEQTWAPTFYGYSEDGVQGFGVRIIETEPSTIYYRIMYPFPEGEWTDWMEYTDMLMFIDPGRYRVEAYAVADGKAPSQTIAYEFMVMPIVQPGDVNNDGIIGIEDVTTLIDIIISNSTPTPECDVNQDGSVDIADVTDLIDYILAQ